MFILLYDTSVFFKCAWADIHVCAHEGHDGFKCLALSLSTLLLRQGLSLNLQFDISARLAGQQAT